MTSQPKLMLAKSTYRDAKRPDGTPGFATGRGRGRGNIEEMPGASLLGLGREHSGIMSAAPPSAGQFEPANEQDDDDDSDEEIVLLKPSFASGASGHSLSVPSADMPASKSDSAEQPNESPQPGKKAEIESLFTSAKPDKKKMAKHVLEGIHVLTEQGYKPPPGDAPAHADASDYASGSASADASGSAPAGKGGKAGKGEAGKGGKSNRASTSNKAKPIAPVAAYRQVPGQYAAPPTRSIDKNSCHRTWLTKEECGCSFLHSVVICEKGDECSHWWYNFCSKVHSGPPPLGPIPDKLQKTCSKGVRCYYWWNPQIEKCRKKHPGGDRPIGPSEHPHTLEPVRNDRPLPVTYCPGFIMADGSCVDCGPSYVSNGVCHNCADSRVCPICASSRIAGDSCLDCVSGDAPIIAQ